MNYLWFNHHKQMTPNDLWSLLSPFSSSNIKSDTAFLKPLCSFGIKRGGEVVIKRQKFNYLQMKRWTHLPGAVSTSKDQAQTAGNWPWDDNSHVPKESVGTLHSFPGSLFNLKWPFPTSPDLFWPQPCFEGNSRSSWHSVRPPCHVQSPAHSKQCSGKGGAQKGLLMRHSLCPRQVSGGSVHWADAGGTSACHFAVLHPSHIVHKQKISNT